MLVLACIGRIACRRTLLNQVNRPLAITRFQPSNLFITRLSTSGVINQLDHLNIKTLDDANDIVRHLNTDEKELLLQALNISKEAATDDPTNLTPAEVKQLFMVNFMPFVGFGLLDNMIMILAGEYIDQSLGALLTISTMAAAALGNIISDLAGVGLAHYVEIGVSKIGIKPPSLNSEQLSLSKARYVVNLGRAAGLVVGCLIGMFPLLFFDNNSAV